MMSQTVATLNLLGDESRIRLCALLHERELSVSDLVRVTGISQSRVSTHLARLREGGLVRDRRQGQHSFYALAAGARSGFAKSILDDAIGSTDPVLLDDRTRLAELDTSRRGTLPEVFAGEMERHYSPGRTWQSLALGIAALLQLGDVLDVGSGDGAAAAILSPYCESLTCIDASPQMVAAATNRFEGHKHVSVQMADVHQLPFRAASFDTALLFHTLTYAEDPQRAVCQCARVLRPHGRLVVLSLEKHDHSNVTSVYGERHPGFSLGMLRSLLSEAGLSLTRCEVACREPKRPHFRVIVAVASKVAPKRRSAKGNS